MGSLKEFLVEIEKLPENYQSIALNEIARKWKNHAEIEDWLNTQPPGPLKDRRLHGHIILNPYTIEPAMAIRLLDQIQNKKAQTDAIENLAKVWVPKGSTVVKEWIQKSSLPEETKKALLNQ